ncbi:MAG: DUF418 domain-containing protein [Rikenellaceae bacterium]
MDNGLNINHNLLNVSPRIAVIDSLRGMAIAAIFLIHTSNHFLYNNFPEDVSSLDSYLKSFLYFIFEGKAYTIFAVLFGFTFALQADNYKWRCGRDFGGVMLWRMVLLVLIGLVNGALFLGGDPLVFYALTMMLVIPLRNLSTSWLTILALVFLIQPLELLNSIFSLYDTTGHYSEYGILNSVLIEGNALSTFWAGMTVGIKGALKWALETGRFTQTIGLFLVGIIAYRHNIFNDAYKWTRHYIKYLVVTVVLYLLYIYVFDFFKTYYNLFFVLSVVSVFVKLEEYFKGKGLFSWLAIYGRLSLTNFVMQSLFGALLYYPWALDLGSKLGVFCSVVITTFFLIIIQILFSKMWLFYFKRGPLEQLWYKATYLFK